MTDQVVAKLATDAPPEWPPPPAHDLAVLAAAELVARARGECDRAEAALRLAVAELEAFRSQASDRLLGALEAGAEAPVDDDDAPLQAAVEAAGRRLAAAEAAALQMAADRHRAELADAEQRFSDAVRPLLQRGLADVRRSVATACAANEALRSLAHYARQQGASTPGGHEIALPLPNPDQLAALLAEREGLFAPPPPLPPGKTLVRMLLTRMPYAPGEQLALDDADAALWVRAGLSELVDPDRDAKRLGVDKLAKFDRPQEIRFLDSFTIQDGKNYPKGSTAVLPPHLAVRACNLGLGKSLGDADG